MSNIRKELSQLLSLWLNMDHGRECFRLMAGSLSSLEFLGLFNPSAEDFAVIPTLPSLRVLVLSAVNRDTPIPPDERPRRIGAFFEMCPHLTRVDIVHQDKKSKESMNDGKEVLGISAYFALMRCVAVDGHFRRTRMAILLRSLKILNTCTASVSFT
ncbi:hypothetical protein BDZ97DRAFT_1358152 [Flammula alnicola]|nr:hypothetical protein BDZ97DRAFT_1358152 [Flammula alnicola]